MGNPDLQRLKVVMEEASAGLLEVHEKRMFGCDAFFAGSAIYGLVWKTGRIGLKFTDPAVFAELMAMPGAAPWTAGDRTMSHWVLVPEPFHDDPLRLRAWVERAHRDAAAGDSVQAPRKKRR